jgi:hypothetical protein
VGTIPAREFPAMSVTVGFATKPNPTTPFNDARSPPLTVTSYEPSVPLTIAIRDTVAVDPETSKSLLSNPLTGSENVRRNVSASSPVVSEEGTCRRTLVNVGAVVSILMVSSEDTPDDPVLTPDTVARALKVRRPGVRFDDGENEYAPKLSATVDPSGVLLPSMKMRTVAPASAAPVMSGVRSLVGVTPVIDGVTTMMGMGSIHDTTSDAGLSFPRKSTAVT